MAQLGLESRASVKHETAELCSQMAKLATFFLLNLIPSFCTKPQRNHPNIPILIQLTTIRHGSK